MLILTLARAGMPITREKLQNPMTAARDADDRVRLRSLFSDLEACPGSHFMALRPYMERCPDRFFGRIVHTLMLDWLKRRDSHQRDKLRSYLASVNAELSAAMLFLRQINLEDWHDRPLVKDDDYEVLRFIDKVLHPAYLRLVEAVLAPLIRPVAHFSRLDRGKRTDGLDIFNLVQELSTTPMAACVNAYNHTVRNGIGHGGITYLHWDIRYRDKKGNEETLDVWSVVRLCDDMIDTCNGLASAIKVFLILSFDRGYQLPRELLVEELAEKTRSPWWSIDGCIESELADSTQLLVYARPNSRDVLKIQWAGMQSAILAESLAPGYGRYFFSLRTPMARAGFAAFDGNSLRRLRESGAAEVHEYASAQTDFFYIPRPALPRLLGTIDTLAHSLRLNWPIALRQIRENLQIPSVVSRDARMHRNGWGYVLNGAVVIVGLQNETAARIIRSHRRRIIRAAAKQARSSASWLNPARYLPLGYAHIAVFSEDFRRRRLSSFGLGPQLVCTIQLQRIRRIKSPDIMGSTIEVSGNWRIAWNRAWIESGGCVSEEPQDASIG
jgi:hypothetical protein